MAIRIKRLNQDQVHEFRSLIEVFNTVFENDDLIAENDQICKLLSNPDFMVFVVEHDSVIVGGLTIYVLHRYYGTKPIAYIYDVGISPEFQGRGFGKALIAGVCSYCQENGFEDAYVEAEYDDTDVVNFYKKTGFNKQLQAIQFIYTFK